MCPESQLPAQRVRRGPGRCLPARGRAFALLLALLPVAACVTPPVGHDVDPQAAIGSFRSFGILAAEAREVAPADPRFGPLLDGHTREAIGWMLRTRGYDQRTGGDVDFIVSYHNDAQEEARIDSHPVTVGIGYGAIFSGFGLGTRWQAPTRSTARKVVKGRLVIDVVDPVTGHLVWRGWTEDTLSPSGDPRRDIFAAVERVLEQFPQAAPR